MAILFLTVMLVWFAGLIWFVAQVPSGGKTVLEKTDAIVVLTGGTGRLDTGLQLLEEGLAQQLFVSGVARNVDVSTLLRVAQRKPDELACCISVGYQADDTAGNARETAIWVGAKGFKSIRLVTASYHMPRSLVEFRRALPDLTILPHPVYPPQFKRDQWWLWPGTAALLSSEFNKYVLARLGVSGDGLLSWGKRP
ncbi:MAG: YdcF family protein [Rhodospirillaceae bacterium]|jgi:uncharacterized SAM-binding protein YcdF (DUF218 family)|nr:YdcF family protein [Rhodospirillaceae bacterium]